MCRSEMGERMLKQCVRRCFPAVAQRLLRTRYLARKTLRGAAPVERELGLLRHLVQPGDHVVDVGANIGTYTLELSGLVGEAGSVWSVEPLPENLDILERVAAGSPFSNVTVFRTALGSETGSCRMRLPRPMEGFACYYLASVGEPVSGEVGVEADVVRFDEVWAAHGRPPVAFMKCDVEGGELAVLQGAEQMLETSSPGLLLEVSRAASERVFPLLQALGYRAFVFADALHSVNAYRDGEFSNYFFFRDGSEALTRAHALVKTVGEGRAHVRH